MKKIQYLVITLLLTICLLPVSVLAAGSISVSTKSITVKKGSKATFKISANNSAGRVEITSSNPEVASVSTSSLFLDMQSGSITVTGNSAGTATITVLAKDVTTYDDEELNGKTYTIKVTVTNPVSNTNTNKPTNTNTNKPTNSNNNLSKNNSLKEIAIDGYTLEKKDSTHYTLTVANNVTNINIKATAEDAKASIRGIGKKDLKVGDNHFEVVVTSESGAQNKIDVKVTRKEDFSLEDLDSLLEDSNAQDISITISKDTIIPKATIEKIKEKKKKVNFNYYNENKKLQYAWIVDGNKVRDFKDILTTISYNPENRKNILKASNYAEGIYASLKQKGDIPKGIRIKLLVADKYEDGYILRLYQYEESKLQSVREDLKVKNGFIEFDAEKGTDYFITMSSLGGITEKIESKESSKLNIFMIISIVEFLIIIVLIIVASRKKENSKNTISKLSNEEDSVDDLDE